MTGDQYNDVEKFVSAIRRGAELWRSIETRIVAARVGNKWHNLITTVYLHHDPESVPRMTNVPRLAEVGCWQSILPVDLLDDLISSISEGCVAHQDEDVHYLRGVGDSSNESSPYGHWSYFFSPISERRGGSSLKWGVHQLTSTGDTVNNYLQKTPSRHFELDSALRALEHPVDGLDGLASLALREPGARLSDRSCAATIFAPIGARMRTEQCRLEGGKLHFQIEANSNAVLDHCSLGFVSGPSSPDFLTGTIEISGNEWEQIDGAHIFTGDHDIANSNDVTLFLRVGGFSVHKVRVLDYEAIAENPRVAAYGVFDPGFEVFDKWLLPDDRPNAQRFEIAVARLLTFLGFQVDILSGDARLGDAVDILAFSKPQSTILAVECTTRSIGTGGKLGKLVNRARHLEASLEAHDVIPVIVTATSRSRLSEAELLEAAQDGIAVLARESLESLLETLVNGSSITRAIQLIRSNVPRHNWPN